MLWRTVNGFPRRTYIRRALLLLLLLFFVFPRHLLAEDYNTSEYNILYFFWNQKKPAIYCLSITNPMRTIQCYYNIDINPTLGLLDRRPRTLLIIVGGAKSEQMCRKSSVNYTANKSVETMCTPSLLRVPNTDFESKSRVNNTRP